MIQDKKNIIHRLKIIHGHLGKVVKMVEEEKYCIDILNQSLAVQNALKKVDALINDHLNSCVVNAITKNKKSKETIGELLTIFKKNNK
jgi:CsoR family transcriptional regulator, copper-sensing transcriptional repressor